MHVDVDPRRNRRPRGESLRFERKHWRASQLPLLIALLLTACGKPSISGHVLPTESERTGLPWQRVEIKLVKGNLMEQLSQLAAKYRQEINNEARQRLLKSVKAEQAARAEAFERSRAALASAGEASPLRTCMPAAEERLARAREDYATLLSQIAPRIAAVGAPTDSMQHTLEFLRAAVKSKTEQEAERLRQEYLRTDIVQRSTTVLAGGSGMDRLCWNVENRRDIGVQFRGPSVLFNGKALPDAIATEVWRLPNAERPLRIPRGAQGEGDVLPPGAQFEMCFFAQRCTLAVDTLKSYGMSVPPSRSGEWKLQWKEITLVSAPDTTATDQAGSAKRAGDTPMTVVFSDRLRPFIAGLEETHLIEAITTSSYARGTKEAETNLLACHRGVEAEEKHREVERAVAAIESGDITEIALDVRLRPILLELARDPARVGNWYREAMGVLTANTVKSLEKSLGALYRFKDVDPGKYTMIAKPTLDMRKPKLWALLLDVETSLEQDLDLAAARDTSLRSVIESMLLERRLQKLAATAGNT